jgi:hypothetical protein
MVFNETLHAEDFAGELDALIEEYTEFGLSKKAMIYILKDMIEVLELDEEVE